MVIEAPKVIRLLVKAGLAALVANEVRGIVLAGPVLWGMYEAGGTAIALPRLLPACMTSLQPRREIQKPVIHFPL